MLDMQTQQISQLDNGNILYSNRNGVDVYEAY